MNNAVGGWSCPTPQKNLLPKGQASHRGGDGNWSKLVDDSTATTWRYQAQPCALPLNIDYAVVGHPTINPKGGPDFTPSVADELNLPAPASTGGVSAYACVCVCMHKLRIQYVVRYCCAVRLGKWNARAGANQNSTQVVLEMRNKLFCHERSLSPGLIRYISCTYTCSVVDFPILEITHVNTGRM